MTRLALVGAAVSFAAWVVAVAKLKMENGKWKMKDRPQFSILHSKFSIHAAVFAFFVGVAVQYAGAKHGGTNAPPNGASPPNGNVELKIENVELRNVGSEIENSELRMGNGSIVAPLLGHRLRRLASLGGYVGDATILHSPLYILHSTVTNDSYSYVMPTNGTRYARWWKRGGYV